MYRFILLFLLLLSIALIHPRLISAGGGTFTNQFTQVAQTESRAVIIFDGEKEVLLDSMTFTINPISQDNFVWVIPVPSKPEVEPIKDELYAKFEKLTEKSLDKSSLWEKIIYFDSMEEQTQPKQFFTRPVDVWKFDIVEPGSYDKLNDSIREMGYFIPKEGRPIIQRYVNDGWYFVVAHVNALHLQMDASESLTIKGAHVLPLKISFETDKPIYPIKLASISPDADSEYAGLGYELGSSSETVLGAKDEKVDALLSEASKNKFPFLPLDYVNMKIDLFIVSEGKMKANDFSTSYANWIDTKDIHFIDLKEKQYINLPDKSWYLTRLFSYQPLFQIEDVEITNDSANTRVNAHSSFLIQIFKLLCITALICIVLYCIKKLTGSLLFKHKLQ